MSNKYTNTYEITTGDKAIRFRLTVDMDEIARRMGRKLMQNKSGKAVSMYGAVLVQALHPDNANPSDTPLEPALRP